MELRWHGGKQAVAVGCAAASHLGGLQEREHVGGVAVERFHQGKHRPEVGVGHGQVPTADDAVLQVIFHDGSVGTCQQGAVAPAEQRHDGEDAARVHRQAHHRTVHLAAVGDVCPAEQGGKEVIERLLLCIGQLQGVDTPQFQFVEESFPFRPPCGGTPLPRPSRRARTGSPIGPHGACSRRGYARKGRSPPRG